MRLERGGNLRVDGAVNPMEVLEQLAIREPPVVAMLMPWPKPEFDPTEFFALIRRADVQEPPYVLAFAKEWTPEVAGRASRLGVHAFLTAPLQLSAVITELMLLRKEGKSHSAHRLIGGRGGVDNQEWRSRMVSIASNIPRKGLQRWEKRVKAMLAFLDQAYTQGDKLPLFVAEALLLFAKRDHRQLDMTLAGSEDLTLEELSELYAATERNAGGQGRSAEARIVRLIEGVVAFIGRRDNKSSGSEAFDDLREQASILLTQVRLTAGGDEPPEYSAFRVKLARLLEVEPEFLMIVPRERMRRIAARALKAPSEDRALDFARLTVLAYVLKVKGVTEDENGNVNHQSLKELANIMGAHTQEEMAVTDRLKALGDELAPTGDEVPDFDSFQEMFCGLAKRADPKIMAVLGLDSRALQRGMTALVAAQGPDPEELKAAEEERPSAGSLLERLSQDLDLPTTQLAAYDSPDLLDRLPEVDLKGVSLAAGALARVSLTALLISDTEDPDVSATLIDAFVRKYGERQDMLSALVQTLEVVGEHEVAARMARLVK